MKKLILSLFILFAFIIPQEIFAQGSCLLSIGTSSCLTIDASCSVDNDAWHIDVINPDGSVATYTAADYEPNTSSIIHEGGDGNYIIDFFVYNNFWFSQDGTITGGSCGGASPICETTPVSFRDGLGNYICDVGAYTLCCDGSFTVTGLQATTKIKVNWADPEVCDVYDNGAGDCNNTFFDFDQAGTVTPGSNFFLEFQSSEFAPDGCGFNYALVFNLGAELAGMDCLQAAARSDENNSTVTTSEITLSPNPANSFVNISNPDAKNLTIEIYNIRGQRLLRQLTNQMVEQIDINTLVHGMYLVRIQDSETQEYISTEKLIVAK